MTVRWPADPSHIAQAAAQLRAGAVIAFPTDTLYAVATRQAWETDRDAKIADGVKKALWMQSFAQTGFFKQGDAQRAVLRNGRLVVEQRVRVPSSFWPGPLTLVLPARIPSDVPTIAVRAPDHDVALALLRTLGEPIASSSANRAGAPPPVDADQVIAGLGDRIDLVLDGGPCRIGQPSTILDLGGAEPRILRQGAIPASELIRG